MDIKRADPRDQAWETIDPSYRVYFHDKFGASDEYEIQGASGVAEVLSWASAAPGDRAFVIYACVSRDGLGLVRLHGREPQ